MDFQKLTFWKKEERTVLFYWCKIMVKLEIMFYNCPWKILLD